MQSSFLLLIVKAEQLKTRFGTMSLGIQRTNFPKSSLRLKRFFDRDTILTLGSSQKSRRRRTF